MHRPFNGSDPTDLANGEPLSVFAIVLNGLRINQLLNVIPTEETDVSSLEEHYSILVKLDGEILSSPHREQIGTAITDLLHGGTITDLLQHNQRQQGSFSDRLDNGKVLVTYNQIPAKNWYILSLAHHDFLFKEINNSGLFTFVIELLRFLSPLGFRTGSISVFPSP